MHRMDDILKAMGIAHQYYSALSMVLHTWRDNCADVAKRWREKFPHTWRQFCERVPPKPITGRWGRASAVEEFLLEGTDWAAVDGAYRPPKPVPKRQPRNPRPQPKPVPVAQKMAEMLEVLSWVIAKRQYAAAAADADANAATPGGEGGKSRTRGVKRKAWDHEIAAEEQELVQKRLGKWAKVTMRCVGDPLFWAALRVSRRARAPLDWLFHSLMKSRKGEQNLAKLVFGRAEEIFRALSSLMRPDAWDGLLRSFPPRVRGGVWRAVFRMASRTAANFERRILGRVRSFPARLLWLGWGQPEERRPERLSVMRDLLQMAEDADLRWSEQASISGDVAGAAGAAPPHGGTGLAADEGRPEQEGQRPWPRHYDEVEQERQQKQQHGQALKVARIFKTVLAEGIRQKGAVGLGSFNQ